jgi:RecA/RadA recombinase
MTRDQIIMAKGSLPDIFKELDKLNPDGSLLSDSALSIVDDWLDTGSYALNAICSGSCYKGIPVGRVVGLGGPSGCGKTLMSTKMIANHQKKSPDNFAIVFDSEIALDAQTASQLGADPARIKHYPINTVNEARNQILKALNGIEKAGLHGKAIIVLDSLGNLAGDKEKDDAEADKFAADMGLRAKAIKGMLRVITMPAARSKTTVIFTNHTYDDPAAMYPSAVQNQSGGKGPIYMASLLIQLGFNRTKNEKDHEHDQMIAVAKKVGGITMKALTAKNRFVPPMLMTEIYLNFKTGLDKYSGLFEMAKALDVVTGDRSYECNGVNLGYRKDWQRNPEVWENTILPVLEKRIRDEFAFHSDVLELERQVEEMKTEED